MLGIVSSCAIVTLGAVFANSPAPRVFNAPAEGVPVGVVYRRRGTQETRMMGLSDGRKSFQVGLAVLIQYRRVTDTHPATQPDTYVAVARTPLTTSRG